jgi:1,4-alpha-glucan branching enzyme
MLSQGPGPALGAVLDTGGAGVTFRVWAPNADHVQVEGDFNNWAPTDLTNQNGTWSLDVAGAQPGQQYKYYLHNASTNSWFWRADPRATQMVNSASNCIIHDPNSYAWQNDQAFQFPDTTQQVIYEMHIGSFVSPGGAAGTWSSAATKLSYLQSLGVNVIEVMPIDEFPGGISWGYNPADPFAPSSNYGKPDDMKSFIDQAHANGMAVILDNVYNHFGPSDLALWQFDGASFGSAPNNGGIYFYNDWRGSTPWGNTRPDYGRVEVQQYISDNVSQWVNEYHADGVRLDMTYYIRQANGTDLPDGWTALQNIANTVHASQPFKLVIAEDMQNYGAVTNPVSSGGAGADVQWDAQFVNPIDAAITAAQDSSRDMNSVAGAVGHNYNGNVFQRVVYTESHDVAGNNQRIPSQIGGWNAGGWNAEKQSTLGAAIAMTSPGRPMIFEGQECLTPGQFQAQTPIDWNLCTTNAGIQQLYTDLIHLRRNWTNTTAGLSGGNLNFFHVDNTSKVVAYHRWRSGGPGDDVVVVANFSSTSFPNYNIGFPKSGTWHVRFNSDSNVYSTQFGNTQTFDVGTTGPGLDGLQNQGTLAIGPYSVVIFSQ